MSRALLLLGALLACAGCDPGSSCDGHDGTCVEVTVHSRTLAEVAQLGFTVGPPIATATTFTDYQAESRAFPVLALLYLPPGPPGTVSIEIVALDGGKTVGRGVFSVEIPRIGAHLSAIANVERIDLPPDDVDVDVDVGAVSTDSGVDLGMLDAAPDQAVSTSPRRVFLAGPFAGNFAVSKSGDERCRDAWLGASGREDLAVALLGGGTAPHDHAAIVDGSTRPVLMPSGTMVSTEATFFSGSHAHAIDELADGTSVVPSCTWTAFGVAGTFGSQPTCAGWMSAAGNVLGGTGSTSALDGTWAEQSTAMCSGSCYLYCLTP
jgi:hypothetical protein